jgi:hypothetical protein
VALIALHTAIWERLVGEIPPGYTVDHVNHDGLDNRPANLRLATHSQQSFNVRRSDNSSGYIGVSWHKREQRWAAQVKHNRKHVYDKYFDDPFSAAWNRDAYCRQHCRRATLNNLVDRRLRQLPFAVERRAKPHCYLAA